MEKKTKPPGPMTVRPGSLSAEGACPRVMGILNVTPDSFSDGGRFHDPGEAILAANQMVEAGADLIDIGGESTRPGAHRITTDAELARVLPVIKGLAGQIPIPISIDTQNAQVARRAVDAGAAIINDVSALRADPAMAATVAQTGASVVLMHMQGNPQTMQQEPVYNDVVAQVYNFLAERIAVAHQAGIAPEKIIVDPGIGFGKTTVHNLRLLARLRALEPLGCPILVGPSRKSFLGAILDLPVSERLEGTAAAVALAVAEGAAIIRVHDVLPMTRVVRVAWEIRQANEQA